MTYRNNGNLTKRCGCGRRQWLACPHAWRFNLQVAGRNERGSLRTADRDQAEIRVAEIRAQLRAGTYAPKRREPALQPGAELTFVAAFGRYVEQRVEPELSAKSLEAHRSDERFFPRVGSPSGGTFDQLPLARVTIEDVEAAHRLRRVRTAETVTRKGKTWTRTTGGDVAANRMLTRLSAFWSWACHPKRALAPVSPFHLAGGQVPDELQHSKEHHRGRRLQAGEEAALLAAAGPHLNDCIVAALEAGLRKGEILSLQWKHVRWLQNDLTIAAENTKTDEAREIPISKTLREVLVRRLAAHPKDHPWKPDHFVFGNPVGERVQDIRTAWRGAVLRMAGCAGRPSPERWAKLREIDLHFHDLRAEGASRKLEGGWPLNLVSKWLGHTSIETTAIYLRASLAMMHEYNAREDQRAVG